METPFSSTPSLEPSAGPKRAASTRTHDVYVRGVPIAIWQRARNNAVLSELSFKLYMTRLMAMCEPFPVSQESVAASS